VARYRGGAIKRRHFRGDAAFALPDFHDFLEAEGYNQRGTAERFIKEGKNAVKWTRLSRAAPCGATRCGSSFMRLPTALPTSLIGVVEHRPHADRKLRAMHRHRRASCARSK